MGSLKTLYLNGELGEGDSNYLDVIKSLREMLDEPKCQLNLIINSNGGDTDFGFVICDLLEELKNRGMKLVCIGQVVMSMAVPIFSLGDHRILYPSSRIMIHRPFWTEVPPEKIFEYSKEIDVASKRYAEILALHTKVSYTKICKMMEKDTYIEAKKAMEMGFCDEIAVR